MIFADHLTLDGAHVRDKTDGYMRVRARAARAGVYDYLGSEVDPTGTKFKATDTVKVYRPASEVFDKASLASFVLRPITDDHPTVAVNKTNWRDHSRGAIFGAVKDGDHVGFDLAFMDGPTIDKVDAGKVELSAGYSCDLAIEDGTTADGTAYQAVQRNIRGNHVALVARGRAGPECRVVVDAAACEIAPKSVSDSLTTTEKTVMKTMLIDGLTVDIGNADTAQATIATILQARDTALGKVTTLDAQVATLTTEKTTLDAKVTTLEQAVKDAKPAPAQLRDAGKALMLAAGKAKALGVTVSDEMDEPAIMGATVKAKMGDAAKDWNDAQIAASFAVLTKDAKVDDTTNVVPLGSPTT
ncbi:MAG: DUF2213 domain-containing protein, partial [Lysobacteraceae bacterium]